MIVCCPVCGVSCDRTVERCPNCEAPLSKKGRRRDEVLADGGHIYQSTAARRRSGISTLWCTKKGK